MIAQLFAGMFLGVLVASGGWFLLIRIERQKQERFRQIKARGVWKSRYYPVPISIWSQLDESLYLSFLDGIYLRMYDMFDMLGMVRAPISSLFANWKVIQVIETARSRVDPRK